MATFTYHQIQTKRPDRLTIGVVLESSRGRWRLGRIEQREHAIYWFSGPFGYHITYHDSNAKRAAGRIHVRLDRNSGGRFAVYPGGEDAGTEGDRWEAPAFQEVRGVLPLPPDKYMLLFRADALVRGRKSGTKGTDLIVRTEYTDLHVTWVGFALLAMESGNETALREWIDDHRRFPSFLLNRCVPSGHLN